MLTREELPPCPVATTLMLIGNKWKVFILQRLLERPWRFNELQRSIPGISQRVLTDNLRAMEADGIVFRKVYPETPVRVEYALSELGGTMRPIIRSMLEWGTMYQKLAEGRGQERQGQGQREPEEGGGERGDGRSEEWT